MKGFERIFDVLYYQKNHFPKKDALNHKVNGAWIHFSTDKILDLVNQTSKYIISTGIRPGDRVALVSNNRVEWNIIDLAITQTGAVCVPVYPTISESDYKYIFGHSEVKLAFVSDAGLVQKITHIQSECPELQKIVAIDEVPGCPHFYTEIKKDTGVTDAQIEEARAAVAPSDMSTIIYTSGTTGVPKGVMLSHANIVSNIQSVMTFLPLNAEKTTLSFLPLCHSFERVVYLTYMLSGCSVYYAESLEKIADNLKEVKPHFFTSVPRLLEKVYIKLEGKSAELTGFKKKLYLSALDFANNYDLDKTLGLWDKIRFALFDKMIFSKWREALGGRTEGICTGAAALQPRLARVFTCAGITVVEGYGQTEASPVITVNPFDKALLRFGTVGVAIPGVEVKLDHREGMREGEGEIICRGPNVMMGYYKRPDITAETIADGWLRTGDVGTWIEYKGMKYLKITDRVKELFKTSGGKYIAPQAIENKMKEIPYIEQILIIGENRNFVTALIVPNYILLSDWCTQHGISTSDKAAIAANPKVQQLFTDAIAEKNKQLGNWETVKKFTLISAEWGVESGELTPTMKPKRKVIQEKFAAAIEDMYRGA